MHRVSWFLRTPVFPEGTPFPEDLLRSGARLVWRSHPFGTIAVLPALQSLDKAENCPERVPTFFVGTSRRTVLFTRRRLFLIPQAGQLSLINNDATASRLLLLRYENMILKAIRFSSTGIQLNTRRSSSILVGRSLAIIKTAQTKTQMASATIRFECACSQLSGI